MLQYVHGIPSQCADDVSTVLGVSVVNELPDIQFYPLSPPPPSTCPTLSTPDSLEVVTVFTEPHWVVSFAALYGQTVKHWIISSSLPCQV